MPRLDIWKCDKCSKQVDASQGQYYTDGWRYVQFYECPVDIHQETSSIDQDKLLWCPSCVRSGKEKMALVAER